MSAKGLFLTDAWHRKSLCSQPNACLKGRVWSPLFHLALLKGGKKKGTYPSLQFGNTFILNLNAVTSAGDEISAWTGIWATWEKANRIHTSRSFMNSRPTFPPWLCCDVDPTRHTDPSVPHWTPARRPWSVEPDHSAMEIPGQQKASVHSRGALNGEGPAPATPRGARVTGGGPGDSAFIRRVHGGRSGGSALC